MAKTTYTKTQVLAMFREDMVAWVIERFGRNDKVAMREAWSGYVDSLCKDGAITAKQYDTWTNPF